MSRFTGSPMWLSPELRDQLDLGLVGPHDDRELREAWEVFGDRLVAEAVEREPGTRPLAW